ncbi:MAG: guanine deaminase [Granulosicoccus sp.]
MKNLAAQYFFGTFMHTPALDQLEILNDTLISVDAAGTIIRVLSPGEPSYSEDLGAAKQHKHFTKLPDNAFYLPGLVDTHIHAPQWPQLGKALHLPLENWLMDCTFPLESKYQDAAFAKAMYSSLVKTLLANGTTSAVYFATVHTRATQILAELCLEKGQRAWVGRVAMDDHTQCPDYYCDSSTDKGLRDSESSIESIRQLSGNESQRVKPIITPRFIPSCTNEMLEGLGDLAKEHSCAIQTHCSESDWEHQYVIDRTGLRDTEALDRFSLLTRTTVLAHANFINHSDMLTIRQRGSGVAHCPLSNQYFAGSVFPLRAALKLGVHVGLGTDISGGPSASQFDTCRHAISASRMLESGVNANTPADERGVHGSRIDYIEAFYLATTGGGVMLDEPIGLFRKGYRFDALHINTSNTDSNLMYFPELDSQADIFQKTLYAATRLDIKTVWVDGAVVSELAS